MISSKHIEFLKEKNFLIFEKLEHQLKAILKEQF